MIPKCSAFMGVFAILIFPGMQAASAQSSTFTYQGALQESGSPASGSYDFQFRLYDTLAGGNQVGSEQVVENATVTDGIFSVMLDFGAASFPGADRFLDIGVRPGVSVDPFTPLTPRQKLTATPYALQSLNAQQLGGTESNQFVLTGDARLSDARVPTAGSANYIQNTASQQAASNFNISGNGVVGGNLTVTGTMNGSGANLANLNANNITTGTLNNGRLSVPLGLGGAVNLGGGIMEANNFANDGVGVYAQAWGTTGRIYGVWGISHNASGVGVQGTSENGAGIGGNSTNGTGVYGQTQNGAAGVLGVSYDPIGIGVQGWGFNNSGGVNYGVHGSSISPSGVGVYGEADSIGVKGHSTSGFGGYFEGKGYFSGDLGIGTAAPEARLSIHGPSSTVDIETAEIARLTRPAVSGVKNTNSAGIFLGAFETGILGRARMDFALSGLPVEGNGYGTIPEVKVMSLLANGNVGIGITNPGYTLHVNGSVAGIGAYNILSDGRFKQEVHLLSHALSTVLQMRGVSYTWRQAEFPQFHFGPERQIGFIAQELAPVLPEAVSRAPDGIQSIAYTTVVPVLVEAIKEQQGLYAAEKADLEGQLAQLRQENAEFRLRLAKLEEIIRLPQ